MNTAVFFSSCNGAVGDAIDLDALAAEYSGSAIVKVVEDFYGIDEFDEILREVESHHLDGVILAGDSPFAYRTTRNGDYLMECLVERGININKIEVVNLLNLVARAHKGRPRELLDKAKTLVDVGLKKLACSHDLDMVETPPRQAVAIVGMNAGSVFASQHLLEAGIKVTILDKGERPSFDEGADSVKPTLARIFAHRRFTYLPQAAIADFHGFAGDFTLDVSAPDRSHQLRVGAVILSPIGDKSARRQLQSFFHVTMDDLEGINPKDDVTARCLTSTAGIFYINPVDRDDLRSLLQASDASVSNVLDLLRRPELEHPVAVTEVDPALCGGCGACVKTCLFHAVTLSGSPLQAVVDPRRCQGCGNCVTACPAGARDLATFPSKYLFDAVDVLASFQPALGKQRALLLACDGCGYECLDRAPSQGATWPVGVMPLVTVCGGQIDTQLIMHAFTKGFDGVALMICGEGSCHNIVGNVDLERRLNLFKQILESRGISASRLCVLTTDGRAPAATIDGLNEFYRELDTEDIAHDATVIHEDFFLEEAPA